MADMQNFSKMSADEQLRSVKAFIASYPVEKQEMMVRELIIGKEYQEQMIKELKEEQV